MESEKRWRRRASYMRAGGHDIAFWTTKTPHPDRQWLLLIHGYPTSSWDWTALWPRLEERFNLAALDMLGFGLSDKPRNYDYTIAEQADLQEALLSELGVGEAHLFVHDYGNTVGQELLARHNEGGLSFAIKSIAFLNGGLFPEQHRARPVQKLGLTPLGFLLGMLLNRDKLRSNFDAIFGPQTKASDDEIDTHWAFIREKDGNRVLHELLSYIPQRKKFRERWVGALKDAQIPMRLINGGADPVSGKHLYDYYKEQIPAADAVLFPELGHYPHTEGPDLVLDAFNAFHKKLEQ